MCIDICKNIHDILCCTSCSRKNKLDNLENIRQTNIDYKTRKNTIINTRNQCFSPNQSMNHNNNNNNNNTYNTNIKNKENTKKKSVNFSFKEIN